MGWSYRVIRDQNGGHRIAEFYEERGFLPSWTAEPVSPYGDSLNELKEDMQRMMSALGKPVLDENELLKREDNP